ncbi:adenosylcobinamide-GDP ribazoletransferase [Allochromatium palmeri]|uniref:Adenosylcobinamide-GDP ribazoletransferase n=1 Tax=Allochromatium palmeri TaxID=231048 RepID=A0A6N8EGU0_9GAMM|nr:adenosylcobinamide-GDP ribazoletransferase [Allochromatium palmeri]MTW21594.1 adenosylcobinamide-GDP ribazoletransferase [Allochromatium palmeri]
MTLRPLWIAGRFLSRLPFPDPGPSQPSETGHSVPWYPFVGLLMGGPAALAALVLAGAPVDVAAALVLMLWVWSSGALHLDGLADSADAWIGGLGSRERTLEIMKDPRSGPAAVTLIGLVLIAKWAALKTLILAGVIWPLLAVPMLARAQLPLLMLTTPYARRQGMAADQFNHLPRRAAGLSVLAAGAVTLALGGWVGLALTLAALALYGIGRRAMLVRLSGFTGDTAGALVELTETLALLLCSLVLGLSPG